MEKVKQYIYEPTYTDNYHVIQIVDGKIERDSIVAYYELDGFLAALQAMGYEKGYFVPQYKMKMMLAQEELEFAQRAYEEAMRHPVELEKDEIEKYRKIVHSLD